MIRFDPVALRERLLGDCGIEFHLNRSLEKSQAVGGLASSADAYVDEAIECLLVDFDIPSKQLLEKALHWLQVAFATNEIPQRHVPHGTEARRFHILAMARWLLHGVHDAESLQHFVDHETRFLEASRLRRDRVEIALVSPHYVNAGAYEEILNFISNARGLALPKNLSSIRNEGQMAYVLSRHHLGQESWSGEEIHDSVHRFLNRNMNYWLTDGHWGRADEWLKIAYWRDGGAGPSPKETLMKAYDHFRTP